MDNPLDKMAARLEDKREMSGRIGETSRFVAFGLIALVFAIHDSSNALAGAIVAGDQMLLNVAGLLGCVAIVCDYLQYFCGYRSVNHALQNPDGVYRYDSRHWAYQGRIVFFWLKQMSAFSGAVLILWIVVKQVVIVADG
ncbi:MAG: hypothetical protein AAGI03_04220 [Pseudomonadota bacterium]